jgi:hypothetical protein
MGVWILLFSKFVVMAIFEVIIGMKILMLVVWVMMPCGLTGRCHHFEGAAESGGNYVDGTLDLVLDLQSDSIGAPLFLRCWYWC